MRLSVLALNIPMMAARSRIDEYRRAARALGWEPGEHLTLVASCPDLFGLTSVAVRCANSTDPASPDAWTWDAASGVALCGPFPVTPDGGV
jgi:hypothetical protein